MPSAILFAYGDVDYGPPKVVNACVIYSLATGRWSETLWELSRLVRVPDYKLPLTRLISKSLGMIREKKLTDLIVSFADAEEDHHGGIYQACSWLYDGMRETRLDGFNVDGVFVPARTCNAVYGTSSEVDLPILLAKEGRTCEPHYDIGKHCYWRALSKDGMRKAIRLGLHSRSYPKPMLDGGEESLLPGHMRKGKVDLSNNRVIKASETVALDMGEDVME